MKISWLSDTLTEFDFLNYIFSSGAALPGQVETEVVIYSGIQREASPALRALSRGSNDGRRVLVHLSDEKLRHRNNVYSKFDLVFRNYFDPRIAWRRNVVFFPLGWTRAFRSTGVESSVEPSLSWSFCGATKADRKLMVDHFVKIAGGFHHFSSGWDSYDQIPPQKVREIYSDSMFVLCPQGNAHVDTFRVMEALQAGAIPVATRFLGRDFFRYTFGDHPFIVEKNWETAAARVSGLLETPSEALAYRRRVQDWYTAYLVALKRLALSAADGEVDPAGLPVRNRHVARSKFDVFLMMRISNRFRVYRRSPKPRRA